MFTIFVTNLVTNLVNTIYSDIYMVTYICHHITHQFWWQIWWTLNMSPYNYNSPDLVTNLSPNYTELLPLNFYTLHFTIKQIKIHVWYLIWVWVDNWLSPGWSDHPRSLTRDTLVHTNNSVQEKFDWQFVKENCQLSFWDTNVHQVWAGNGSWLEVKLKIEWKLNKWQMAWKAPDNQSKEFFIKVIVN